MWTEQKPLLYPSVSSLPIRRLNENPEERNMGDGGQPFNQEHVRSAEKIMDATKAWESEHEEWLLRYRKWQEEHFLWQQQQQKLLFESLALSPTVQQFEAAPSKIDLLRYSYSEEHRATPVHQRLKRSFSSPFKAALTHLNSLKSPLRGVSGSTISSSSGKGSRFATAAATVAKQGILKTGQAIGNVMRKGATLRKGTYELLRRQEDLQRQVMEQREILLQLQQKQDNLMNTLEDHKVDFTQEQWPLHTGHAEQGAASLIAERKLDDTVHIMPEVEASIDWIVNVGMNPKAQAAAAIALRQLHKEQVKGRPAAKPNQMSQKELGARLVETRQHPRLQTHVGRRQAQLIHDDLEAPRSSGSRRIARDDLISRSGCNNVYQTRCSTKCRHRPAISNAPEVRRKSAWRCTPTHRDHLCYGDTGLDTAI